MKYNILLLFTGFTLLCSCKKKELNPKITTLGATPVSAYSCTAKAEITEFGAYAILDHGFVFSYGSSENINYISEQNKVSLGKNIPTDTFSVTFPLTTTSYYSGNKYYVRSFITNEKGTVYGNPVSFEPLMISMVNISPSSGHAEDTISINGNNFDPVTTNNTVQFYYNYSYYLAKIVSASRTTLKVVVPSINSNYDFNCDIKVNTGTQSVSLHNVFSYKLLIVTISNISPFLGNVGDTTCIYGDNFDPVTTNNTVQFYYYNSYYPAKIVEASKTILKVVVPSVNSNYYDPSCDIKVTTGTHSVTLNDSYSFKPSVSGFSPQTGTYGTTISITGIFPGQSSVMFDNTTVGYFSSGGNMLNIIVPSNIFSKKFKIYVMNGSTKMEVPGGKFVMNPLTITSMTPASTFPGSSVSIYGTNFNTYRYYNTVFFGNVQSSSVINNLNSLDASIPNNISAGNYIVKVCNGSDTAIVPGTLKILNTTVTSISPSSGYAGKELIITGHNFNPNYNYIYLNGLTYTATYYDSSTYKLKIPNILSGIYKVAVYNGNLQIQSSTNFTLLNPSISSITPTSISVGSSVLIKGEGFGTSTSYVIVKFGNILVTPYLVNNTEINAIVPNGLASGPCTVSITVYGYGVSNSLTLSVP